MTPGADAQVGGCSRVSGWFGAAGPLGGGVGKHLCWHGKLWAVWTGGTRPLAEPRPAPVGVFGAPFPPFAVQLTAGVPGPGAGVGRRANAMGRNSILRIRRTFPL